MFQIFWLCHLSVFVFAVTFLQKLVRRTAYFQGWSVQVDLKEYPVVDTESSCKSQALLTKQKKKLIQQIFQLYEGQQKHESTEIQAWRTNWRKMQYKLNKGQTGFQKGQSWRIQRWNLSYWNSKVIKTRLKESWTCCSCCRFISADGSKQFSFCRKLNYSVKSKMLWQLGCT